MPITLPAASCLPLVTIGTACADSMSARATQSPLTMPDIRLHALPNSQNYRSVLLTSGGVHIRRVRCLHVAALPKTNRREQLQAVARKVANTRATDKEGQKGHGAPRRTMRQPEEASQTKPRSQNATRKEMALAQQTSPPKENVELRRTGSPRKDAEQVAHLKTDASAET